MKNLIKLSALVGTILLTGAVSAQTTNPAEKPTTPTSAPAPTSPVQTDPTSPASNTAKETAKGAVEGAQREATQSPGKLPAPSGGVAVDTDGKPSTGTHNSSPGQVSQPQLPVREVPQNPSALPVPNTNVPMQPHRNDVEKSKRNDGTTKLPARDRN